jgi:hypothetical protein
MATRLAAGARPNLPGPLLQKCAAELRAARNYPSDPIASPPNLGDVSAKVPVDSACDPINPRPNVEGVDDDEHEIYVWSHVAPEVVQEFRDRFGGEDYYCDGYSVTFDGDIVIEKLDRT